MANSLASTLITRVLDNVARSSVGTTRSGVTMADKGIEWVNTIQRRMSNLYDFNDMKKVYTMNTVTDVKVYNFPSAYKSIVSMRLIDGTSSRKLIMITNELLDKWHASPDSDTTGRPLWYAPFGNTFTLYPIPDAVYAIQCRSIDVPTKITASTDSLTYNDDKDDMIVAGATAEGFKFLQMYEDAIYWDKMFAQLFSEAKKNESYTSDLSPNELWIRSDNVVGPSQDYWNSPWYVVR